MNRILPSLVAVAALTACSREEKPPEKAVESHPPGQAATPAPSEKTPPPPTAAEALAALKAPLEVRAKKTSAAVVSTSLVNAVEQFMVDYDRMPLAVSAIKITDCRTDSSSKEHFIAILKGNDDGQNPRRTDYLGDIEDAKREGSQLTGGISVEAKEMTLFDPWGNPYHILLDLDMDGKLSDPSQPSAENPAFPIQNDVIVWSNGPDGREETWGDNICSWKQE